MTTQHRGGSGGKNICKFFSVKTGKTEGTDSILEMDYLYWLDADPAVKSFRTHPFTLSYVANGKLRRYTPDVLVERCDKRQVVEVKPTAKAAWPRYVSLFRTVSPIFRALGFEFTVVTSESVQQQPHLENLKILWKYARTKFEPAHQVLCHEFLRERKSATLLEVTEFVAAHDVPIQVVYSLLFWRVLSFDIKRSLGPSALIWMPGMPLLDGKEEGQNRG
jgi:hypothetical protein